MPILLHCIKNKPRKKYAQIVAIIAHVSIKLNPNLELLDQVFSKLCWTERVTEVHVEVTQSFNLVARASLI